MKLKVSLALALSLMLSAGSAWSMTNKEVLELLDEISVVTKIAIRGLPDSAKPYAQRFIPLGLDMAKFGLTAETKINTAKNSMGTALKALVAAQEPLAELKSKLAKLEASKGSSNEKDALMFAILDETVAPLTAFAKFMEHAGKDIFAEVLILLERIDPAVANVMKIKGEVTMGKLIGREVDGILTLVSTLTETLAKLQASLQDRGIAAEKVEIAPATKANPFADFDDLI